MGRMGAIEKRRIECVGVIGEGLGLILKVIIEVFGAIERNDCVRMVLLEVVYGFN